MSLPTLPFTRLVLRRLRFLIHSFPVVILISFTRRFNTESGKSKYTKYPAIHQARPLFLAPVLVHALQLASLLHLLVARSCSLLHMLSSSHACSCSCLAARRFAPATTFRVRSCLAARRSAPVAAFRCYCCFASYRFARLLSPSLRVALRTRCFSLAVTLAERRFACSLLLAGSRSR